MLEQQTGVYHNPYKFNAKELDSQTSLYYYGARYYNPRLSIWYGVDPLSEKYPSISPYAYCMDNPVNAVDPNGEEIIFIQIKKDGTQIHLQYRKGSFYYLNGDRKGEKYDGRIHQVSKNLFRIAKAYRKIEHSKNAILKDRLHTLENSKNKHYLFDPVKEDDGSGMQGSPGVGSQTIYNLTSKEENARYKEIEGIPSTDLATVAHEMQHQFDKEIDNQGDATNQNDADNPSEQRAVKTENEARKIEGSPIRKTYGGRKITNNPPNYTLPNEKAKK
jgi:RHS repeat-associated protein